PAGGRVLRLWRGRQRTGRSGRRAGADLRTVCSGSQACRRQRGNGPGALLRPHNNRARGRKSLARKRSRSRKPFLFFRATSAEKVSEWSASLSSFESLVSFVGTRGT